MPRIIDEWDVTGKGDYILTLDEQIPKGKFNRYRIADKDYSVIPVHFSTMADPFRYIGIKDLDKGDFVGKTVEFINI